MDLAEYIRARSPEVEPGLSDEALAALEAELGVRLPEDVRRLIAQVGGYAATAGGFRKMENVTFASGGPHADGELFPACLFLLHNGCGDHWILDIDRQTGESGHVVFASHDPPLFAFQFRTLDEFIQKTLDPEFDLKACEELTEENCINSGIPAFQARESADASIREFGLTLRDDYQIFDLRGRQLPCCFYWGLTDPDSNWKRWKHELLFALSDKPMPEPQLGFWTSFKRLFLGR